MVEKILSINFTALNPQNSLYYEQLAVGVINTLAASNGLYVWSTQSKPLVNNTFTMTATCEDIPPETYGN